MFQHLHAPCTFILSTALQIFIIIISNIWRFFFQKLILNFLFMMTQSDLILNADDESSCYESSYYEMNEYHQMANDLEFSNQTLCAMHLNVRGLSGKLDQLTDLVTQLKDEGIYGWKGKG